MKFTTERIKALIEQQNSFLTRNCLKGKGCCCIYTDKEREDSTQVMYCSAIEMMIGESEKKVDTEGNEYMSTKGFQIACVEVLAVEGTECDLYEENYL